MKGEHSLVLSNHKDLILRPLVLTDQEYFYAINTHPAVRRYLWDDVTISRQKSLDLLQENERQFAVKQFGLWKIIESTESKTIGYTGLWYFFEESQPQLIFAIHPDHQGLGWSVIASQMVIRYAFETLGFEYLNAATDQDNIASQKVLLKLGMKSISTHGGTHFYSKVPD